MNHGYKYYREPERMFTVDDWDKGRHKDFNEATVSRFRCKLPLSLVVKGKINTSAFEEAIIEDL
jgi:hypothetical protein